MSRADNFVKKLRNLTISDPKLDLHNINAHTKFGENPFIFTQDITRKRNYGRTVVRQTAGRTDGYTDNQLETIIVWRGLKRTLLDKKRTAWHARYQSDQDLPRQLKTSLNTSISVIQDCTIRAVWTISLRCPHEDPWILPWVPCLTKTVQIARMHKLI